MGEQPAQALGLLLEQTPGRVIVPAPEDGRERIRGQDVIQFIVGQRTQFL